MHVRFRGVVLALSALAASGFAPVPVRAQPTRLVANASGFHFDGRKLQIISGEMHYTRVPRAYWRDRFRKARAMGLNTISTYVFWNVHEPTPGVYDFAGQNDVAEFVREAGQEGLHVILRPGPYVCAEWDLGGYPAWLLADSAMVLRSTHPHFTAPAARWLDRLGRELAPLLSSHGGPIMAVQVENEYGSFDQDKAYMAWQLGALRHAGFNGVLLYTADGAAQLPNGTLPELPAVVNFGSGGAESAFARLARFRPKGPRMSGEYWAGWFDQWGQKHHTTNASREARELAWMLDRGYSVNLYMFHGGTTFGFMNGANIDGGTYHPQTTSYDYDAPLDESGRVTPKYSAFREVIAKHVHGTLPVVPVSAAAIAVPEFAMTQSAALFTRLPKPVRADHPRSMESMGQSYGYLLYRTQLTDGGRGMLVVRDVRDYAQVYVNGSLVGTLDRRLRQDSLTVDLAKDATLDILVENSGRVNFRKDIRTERSGITQRVTLGGVELTGWDMYALPMSTMPAFLADGTLPTGPGFYRGSFDLARVGDTFLDTRGWGKGAAWINGHLLGRFWHIGPQQSLYVPAVWLRTKRNEVVVFDLVHPARHAMSGVPTPVLALEK